MHSDFFHMLRDVTGCGPTSGAPHFRGTPKAESDCCVRGADMMHFYLLLLHVSIFFHIMSITLTISDYHTGPGVVFSLVFIEFCRCPLFRCSLRLQHSPSIKKIQDSRNRSIHSMSIELCENDRNMHQSCKRYARLS